MGQCAARCGSENGDRRSATPQPDCHIQRRQSRAEAAEAAYNKVDALPRGVRSV